MLDDFVSELLTAFASNGNSFENRNRSISTKFGDVMEMKSQSYTCRFESFINVCMQNYVFLTQSSNRFAM